MKAPFAYYGGKSRLADRILSLIPPHRVYLEPWAGSLAVLFAKPAAVHEIVNDIDLALVTFLRVLRERQDELEHVCALTPHARVEYKEADLDAHVAELEVARRFWVRVNQSFAKTVGRRTGWSVTTARSSSIPSSVRSRLGRFADVASRLMEVSIECCDGSDLVERLATTPDAVVYADPPYVASTRNGRERGRAADYRHEMTDAEHVRLASVLHATPATVVLSGYPGPLYDEMYADWWHVDVPVTVQSSNSLTVARAARVERIWTNREAMDGRLPLAVGARRSVDTRQEGSHGPA